MTKTTVKLSCPLFPSLLSLILFAGSGCGLMIHGSKQEVRFNVKPEDAVVYVDGREVRGNSIELERKKTHRFTIQHPDYAEKQGRIEKEVDPAAVVLNLVGNFGIGVAIDAVAGSLHTLEPDTFNIELKPMGEELPAVAEAEKPKWKTETSKKQPSREKSTPTSPSRPVVQPAYQPEGERWALVVGISRYEDSDIPAIPNAAEDARAVRDFLVNPKGGGYKPDHVFLLTDFDATARKMERYLDKELQKKVQREDDLLLYFACHGMALPKPGTGSEDGLEKFLIPYDTVPEDVAVDGIAMAHLESTLNALECREVAMVLDTCFSGGARSISVGPATRNTTISSSFLKKLGKQRGTKRRKVLTACSADELAQDDPVTGHGIFTTYFLEALHEAEDTDGNGYITLYEIFRFLDRKVRERSADIGQRQHPQWVGDPAYPFNVKKVEP